VLSDALSVDTLRYDGHALKSPLLAPRPEAQSQAPSTLVEKTSPMSVETDRLGCLVAGVVWRGPLK
jgi:hypothetical protein